MFSNLGTFCLKNLLSQVFHQGKKKVYFRDESEVEGCAALVACGGWGGQGPACVRVC